MKDFTWQRRGGYECSSKGDSRFSAFNAKLSDGRSIEQHYQCDVKGYDPGGTNWRLGKGKPSRNQKINLWYAYLTLWRRWAKTNGKLLDELIERAAEYGNVLSDVFATSDVNQANALSVLLNERVKNAKNKRKTTP